MKVKITSKTIRQNFDKKHIFFAGSIENEMTYFFGDGDFYNTGVYGWNYNVYDFCTFCVIYGYRSFPAYTVLPDSVIEYMKNAMEEDRKISWIETGKKNAFRDEVKRTFYKMIVDHLNAN